MNSTVTVTPSIRHLTSITLTHEGHTAHYDYVAAVPVDIAHKSLTKAGNVSRTFKAVVTSKVNRRKQPNVNISIEQVKALVERAKSSGRNVRREDLTAGVAVLRFDPLEPAHSTPSDDDLWAAHLDLMETQEDFLSGTR